MGFSSKIQGGRICQYSLNLDLDSQNETDIMYHILNKINRTFS